MTAGNQVRVPRKKKVSNKRSQFMNIMDGKYFRIIMLVCMVGTGFLYVLQINLTATKGYDIRDLEQKITLLQKESREYELQAMELQSLDRVKEQLPSYYLVEARAEDYVRTSTTTFASR